MADHSRNLQAWRQFDIGQRVELKTRWRRGESGTVVEKLVCSPGMEWTGYARYGVRLDRDGRVTDMSRHELRREA